MSVHTRGFPIELFIVAGGVYLWASGAFPIACRMQHGTVDTIICNRAIQWEMSSVFRQGIEWTVVMLKGGSP